MSLLEITNLTKKFGGLTAVNNVSFSIEDNQIVGLIGPNGAGKTTVFNLITGVYKVSSGKIIFDSNEINNMDPYKIANKGAVRTFQNIRLFKDLTVYENILTACQASAKYSIVEGILLGSIPRSLIKNTRYYRDEEIMKKEADYLLEYMGFSDKKDFKAKNLPYGLQRKLEIARALALKPKLLLLDEPAAGMNPEETNRLTEMILDIKNKFKLSILLIEHHMDLVMDICDKIVVLNFGSKLAEGTPSEIQSSPKVREAYLGGEE